MSAEQLHHARIVALAAQRLARDEAKDALRAKGLKPSQIPLKEINALAQTMLRPELIERAKRDAAAYFAEQAEEREARRRHRAKLRS